jgi:hypothetical protein
MTYAPYYGGIDKVIAIEKCKAMETHQETMQCLKEFEHSLAVEHDARLNGQIEFCLITLALGFLIFILGCYIIAGRGK